jgi:hypothetical protein
MTRYIIINRDAAKVFYDVTANSPIEAAQKGDIEIGGETTDYEATGRNDIKAVWDVYSAPADFAEIAVNDVSLIKSGCSYEVTLKAA